MGTMSTYGNDPKSITNYISQVRKIVFREIKTHSFKVSYPGFIVRQIKARPSMSPSLL